MRPVCHYYPAVRHGRGRPVGAGAILKQSEENQITGLTTAASIWLTAAVGIAAGMGREGTAVISALFAFVILSLLRKTKN
jgi:putative Mg2+ transporter-C (MgtC) family protein